MTSPNGLLHSVTGGERLGTRLIELLCGRRENGRNNQVNHNLVPRGCIPFGQHQGISIPLTVNARGLWGREWVNQGLRSSRKRVKVREARTREKMGDWGVALRHYIFIQQRSTVAEPDMISSQMLEKINMLFTGQGRSLLNITGTVSPYVGFPAGK